jgi:hypothetical protein
VSRDRHWRISQRAKQKAIRNGDWKYLVTADGESLFDLVSDPGEKAEMLPSVPLDPASR